MLRVARWDRPSGRTSPLAEILLVLQAQNRRQRKPVIVVRVDPLGEADDPHLALVHELLERR